MTKQAAQQPIYRGSILDADPLAYGVNFACRMTERFFNKIKHYRAVATRYDKRDDNFLATMRLASIRIWLRFNESMT